MPSDSGMYVDHNTLIDFELDRGRLCDLLFPQECRFQTLVPESTYLYLARLFNSTCYAKNGHHTSMNLLNHVANLVSASVQADARGATGTSATDSILDAMWLLWV